MDFQSIVVEKTKGAPGRDGTPGRDGRNFDPSKFRTFRVSVNDASAGGGELNFFIKTNSSAAPIVIPADNAGFPAIRDFYARATKHQGNHGIHVTVRFESAARGRGFAVNVFQPNMSDTLVIPLD